MRGGLGGPQVCPSGVGRTPSCYMLLIAEMTQVVSITLTDLEWG